MVFGMLDHKQVISLSVNAPQQIRYEEAKVSEKVEISST